MGYVEQQVSEFYGWPWSMTGTLFTVARCVRALSSRLAFPSSFQPARAQLRRRDIWVVLLAPLCSPRAPARFGPFGKRRPSDAYRPPDR